MITQDAFEAIHGAADTVGLIVSLPLLLAIVQLIRFASKIENELKNTASELRTNTNLLTKSSDDHELRLRVTEGKVGVLWDGHERRARSPIEGE